MNLQGSPHLEKIEDIRLMLNLKHSQWADLLEITKEQYFKHYIQTKDPPANAVMKLCKNLNITLENLLQSRYDKLALIKQFHGNKRYIPEKYTVGAGSKIRVLLNTLSFAQSRHGVYFRYYLQRHLQIADAALYFPEDLISLKVFEETYQIMEQKGFTKEDLFLCGVSSALTNKKSAIGAQLSKNDTVAHAYEDALSTLKRQWDNNSIHTLDKLEDNKVYVKTVANPDALDALGVKVLGTPNTCAYRSGTIGSIPIYLGMPHAKAKEIKCVHRGDPYCLVEADFSEANYAMTSNVIRLKH